MELLDNYFSISFLTKTQDAVAKWNVLMELRQPKEAYAAIIQMVLDGLIECSLNPNEGLEWPIDCTDAMAKDLIAHVLQRVNVFSFVSHVIVASKLCSICSCRNSMSKQMWKCKEDWPTFSTKC